MSLTGSMYTGISGLLAHSKSMSVISNNLANSNTIGFKSATMQFEDVFYASLGTANGLAQVGNGVTVSSIYNDFSQGSYESSSDATDVAIGGNGFFMVTNPQTGSTYYTRAGDFLFDTSGYLVNAQGYRVQGWDAQINSASGLAETVGSLSSIQLSGYQSPPEATSQVSLYANLNSDAEDNSTSAANPFLAMLEQWNGTDATPLDDSQYAYQTTLTVYDEAGGSHDLTVYFDPVNDAAVTSGAGGATVWEYIVTCNPSEDGRTLGGADLNTTSAAGMLMTGTLTMNTSGQLVGLTAFTLGATAAGDFLDPANWTPAEFSEDGYPMFTANFSDSDTGNYTGDTDAVNIALNLGLRNSSSPPTWNGAPADASALGNSFANLFSFSDYVRDADATTSYEAAFTTLYQAQDGFATGYLEDISIDSDGVIWAQYTNGQTDPLAILGLADFYNTQGLILEGGNLYSQSFDSGLPTIGTASTARFGTIQPNTLEQSNVDMATEMVRLITIQRGYSANGKVITTADTMLQEALNLKR